MKKEADFFCLFSSQIAASGLPVVRHQWRSELHRNVEIQICGHQYQVSCPLDGRCGDLRSCVSEIWVGLGPTLWMPLRRLPCFSCEPRVTLEIPCSTLMTT